MTKKLAAGKAKPSGTTKSAQGAPAAGAPPRGWVAGASGNPKGRPPGRPTARDEEGRSLGEMARALSFGALQTLREIHEDPTTPKGVRVAASEALLRRGWADAPPPSHTNAMEGVTINVQNLIVQGAAVPGILQSPVQEHIVAAEDASELLDVDGSTVQPIQHEGP